MASHRSTPKSVLNAPTRTVTVRAWNRGPNRAARRQDLIEARREHKALKRTMHKNRIPARPTIAKSANRPYVRPEVLVLAPGESPTVSGRVGSAVGRVRSMLAGRRERA